MNLVIHLDMTKTATKGCSTTHINKDKNGVKITWKSKHLHLDNAINFGAWIPNLQKFLEDAVKQGLTTGTQLSSNNLKVSKELHQHTNQHSKDLQQLRNTDVETCKTPVSPSLAHLKHTTTIQPSTTNPPTPRCDDAKQSFQQQHTKLPSKAQTSVSWSITAAIPSSGLSNLPGYLSGVPSLPEYQKHVHEKTVEENLSSEAEIFQSKKMDISDNMPIDLSIKDANGNRLTQQQNVTEINVNKQQCSESIIVIEPKISRTDSPYLYHNSEKCSELRNQTKSTGIQHQSDILIKETEMKCTKHQQKTTNQKKLLTYLMNTFPPQLFSNATLRVNRKPTVNKTPAEVQLSKSENQNTQNVQKTTKCHPAPLPLLPSFSPAMNLMTAPLPSKPVLRIVTVPKGIILTWSMLQSVETRDIKNYQLYAYQQSSAPPTAQLWKKASEVKGLQLPIACLLTTLKEGYTYHFAVRAMDKYQRYGPFSNTSSIHLKAKS